MRAIGLAATASAYKKTPCCHSSRTAISLRYVNLEMALAIHEFYSKSTELKVGPSGGDFLPFATSLVPRHNLPGTSLSGRIWRTHESTCAAGQPKRTAFFNNNVKGLLKRRRFVSEPFLRELTALAKNRSHWLDT